MGRFRISYRLSLVVIIPLVVLVTGGVIAWRTYSSTRATVNALADDLFANVAQQAVEQTRAHLLRAIPTVEMARTLAAGTAAEPDQTSLQNHLIGLLRANPEVSWISWSLADGSFIGALRSPERTLRINRSRIADGKTVMNEVTVADDGTTTPFRDSPDTKYDPRTRPFYQQAAAAHARVWTPPYVFFDQGVPGITCAAPDYDGDTLRGVATVDFDLNALSQFVAKLELSEHGRVFLITQDDQVIAHPSVKLVWSKGQGSEGQLVTVADVADPMVQQLIAAAGTRRSGDVRFEHDGESWRGSLTPFDVDRGLRWVVVAAAPERDFLHGVQRANQISLIVSAIAVLVAMLLGFVLASRIAQPLAEIAGEMERVGQFRVEDRPARSTVFAEIALMDGALHRMKQGLRSFGRYVPADLVRSVLASGREAVLVGEVKPLTILFSDIANFTSIAETMPPDALVRLLGGYFEETTRIISEKHGTVDKFIGDGVMAFWGAPEANPEHARLACEASLLYQRRIDELKAAGEPWAQHLSARIGLATGEVLVGNIGSPARLNYTVMGDTVNLSARLEGLNKVYGTRILVSEATFDAARDHVIGRAIDVVAVKGKAKGVRLYEILGFASDGDPSLHELAALSERALDAYLAQDLNGAITTWRQLIAIRPGDQAATVMIARAEGYLASPPERWSGVHIFHEK